MSRYTLPLIAALGAVIGAGVVWSYDRLVAPDDVDRARIERVVHDYVLSHPEVLPQAMQKLQERQSGELVAANRDAIVTPVGSAWAGNPHGDVTLVEYFDYNCGYCRASLPMIADLVKRDPQLRIVYRELPILSEESRVAARASLAAALQGRFAAFHDALYAAGPVSEASIKGAAAKAGLNLTAIDPATIDTEIAKNMQIAAKLGMNGTPSWIVGDRVLSGALPIEEIEKAIAAARTR